MVGLCVKLLYRIFFSWPLWIIITFTQYIEWFDAVALGLTTCFFSYAFKWGNAIGITLGIAVGDCLSYFVSLFQNWFLYFCCGFFAGLGFHFGRNSRYVFS